MDSVIHHSGYNLTGRQENDVGLIRLKRPAILGRENMETIFSLITHLHGMISFFNVP